MPKTSDWIIIATQGTTVSDGRVISESWINDMAELYDPEEYKALIWPEHFRSSWAVFEGKNWGEVEELKSGMFKDQLRLFAKITPNRYLLEANQDGQKLFSSVEPEPDYRGQGRCYLMGLAATDSPASSGTTRMRFSRIAGGDYTELEVSHLEELDLSSCFSRSEKFFAMCSTFFSSGDEVPETPNDSQNEDDEPMNEKQFSQMMEKLEGIETKQADLEKQQNEFSKQLNPEQTPEATPEPEKPETGISPEQFSQLNEKLDGIITQQSELDKQFKALSEESPGQRPSAEGANETSEEAL